MPEKRKYIFGPVPSRRLGLSLGVDMVPGKVCSFDCVYCQLGRTTDTRITRGDFVPVDELVAELADALAAGPRPDYITLSGSGEPTLNMRLGEIIDRVHDVSDVPVAILTNGTLLIDPQVRREAARADLVVPSLDAADEATFQRINRPERGVTLDGLVEGLEAFRDEFAGQMWLEVFIIAGMNDSDGAARRLVPLIERIRPDRVQLNTATRPTAEPDVMAVSPERLDELARLIGHGAEAVASFRPRDGATAAGSLADDPVLAMIRRRPVTADDIAAGLAAHPAEVAKALGHLMESGLVRQSHRDDRLYYESVEKP